MKKEIRPEQVIKVYSGRPGCCCGCRGNYSTSKLAITRMLKKFAEANAKTPLIASNGLDGEMLVDWENETGTRTYIIYFKAE